MLFNQEKTLVAWNRDNLDTYHDIIVSFDYARFSRDGTPNGGFCVAFFESRQDVPTLGGPGSSLGYTPNNQKDYCYQGGYRGFVGGFLGIGFDSNGDFGVRNENVDGLETPIPNSCTVRSSEVENYRYIDTSKNFAFNAKAFLIAESNYLGDPIFKTIRIIISKAFTDIEVQIKNLQDKEFFTVLKTKIPVRRRTAVRVGLTNTTIDDSTNFLIKNFNVAGFPGLVSDPELAECATTQEYEYIPGKTIVSADDFCAIPINGDVNVYEIRDGKFAIKQTIQEAGPAYLIGGNERFLFLNVKDTFDVEVYFRTNNLFLKTQTIQLKEEIDPIRDEFFGGFPECADTDNKTLAIGNKKNIFLFQFFTGISSFGIFSYIQTILPNLSGDIGFSVQLEGDKLLTGGGVPIINGRRDSFVSYYQSEGLSWTEDPVQTFVSPKTGNPYNEFGYSISMQGNEAVIGSPNEKRRNRETLGHGDVFHYVFARNRSTGRREWRSAMALGDFFNIDSPGGNLGTSVSFLGNSLVVSAPYENYHFPPDLIFENKPNCGRLYVYRKNRGGTFSQTAIIAPDPFRAKEYMLFGRYAGLLGRQAAVAAVTYNNDPLNPAELDIYKIGCIFDTPPPHLPITLDSIGLYDNSGYTIDIETFTYLQLIKIDDTGE